MYLKEKKQQSTFNMFSTNAEEKIENKEIENVNIDYISDLHVDSYIPADIENSEELTREYARNLLNTNKSDMLIVDGDISDFNSQVIWVLDEYSKYYKEVLFVLGNHEYHMSTNVEKGKYKRDTNLKVKEIYTLTADNPAITVCSSMKVLDYKGKTIVAGTLWYPLDTQTKRDYYNTVSHDSKHINGYDIALENRRAIGVLETIKDMDLVITHMPPYATEGILSGHKVGCYNAEVDLTKVDTKSWLYGHTHENKEYLKRIEEKEIKLYTNTKGYKKEGKEIKIRTLTI